MKVVHALAVGVTAGGALHSLLTALNVMSPTRAIVYAVILGAFVIAVETGEDKDSG